jgi:putative membrane protein
MQNRRILAEACCFAIALAGGMTFAASLSPVDEQFLKTAAVMDMTAAHESQMAENQASHAEVKSLAQTLVQDDTDCYNQLVQIAGKAGASVPTGINAAKIPTIEQLTALKGTRFDRQYVADEIAVERHAIAVFRREAAQGKDPDLKSYVARRLPVLEKDLKQAEASAKIG